MKHKFLKIAFTVLAISTVLTVEPASAQQISTEGLDRKITALRNAMLSLQNSIGQRFDAFEQRLADLESPASSSSSSSSSSSNANNNSCSSSTSKEYRWDGPYNQLCRSGEMGSVRYEQTRTATTDCNGNTEYSRWILVTGAEAAARNSRVFTPANCI